MADTNSARPTSAWPWMREYQNPRDAAADQERRNVVAERDHYRETLQRIERELTWRAYLPREDRRLLAYVRAALGDEK